MKKTISLFISFLLSLIAFSQTTLSAGDIAILQYNADGSPEVMKFIALKSMETGTTINFTDKGWKSDNTFRSGEGVDTWTATSNIKCGDIITFTFTNVALGTNGDQIIAYQGTLVSPSFIFAINNNGAANWQTTSGNPRNSAIPTGLTNGINAIAITEIDNAKYDSSTLAGSKSTILSAICTNANWSGSNSVNQTFTDTFTSETTWTSFWSNPSPENYFKAIIDGDYDTATNGDFTTCELEINASNTLTVNSGGTVTVENGITNNGEIIIEDNGSLVQNTKDGVNTGTNYTVERQSTSQPEEGNYTYWSSPLTSSTLADITNAQLYYSFTASTQTWVAETSSSSMTPGKGYINTGDSSISYPNTYTASFNGSTFNNGDISITLGFSSDGDADNDWNLLGNPYPSAIDADTFIADNVNIGGTLYFWTHNTADSVGDNTQDDYVLWNGTGSTGSCTGCIAPTGNIASGQGFFAQALASGSAIFTNSMRISGSNDHFYKGQKQTSTTIEENRIWLNLTGEQKFSQLLIGFMDDATDGFDRLFDGPRLDGGAAISFSSVLNDKPYGILGKAFMKKEEIIQLSINAKIVGDFKISIGKLEGLLKTATVVLIDDETGINHDLKKGDYAFKISSTGVINNRFRLYITSKTANTKVYNLNRADVKVFSSIYALNILANTTIKEVKVYDLYGQVLFEGVNQKQFSIYKNTLGSNRILVIKIHLATGEVISKKVVFST
jgi:hypothetical protein